MLFRCPNPPFQYMIVKEILRRYLSAMLKPSLIKVTDCLQVMALGRQGLAQFASKFSSTAYKSASERVTLTPVAAAAVAVCSGAPFQPAWQCLAHAQPSTAQVFPAGQHAAFVAPSYTVSRLQTPPRFRKRTLPCLVGQSHEWP